MVQIKDGPTPGGESLPRFLAAVKVAAIQFGLIVIIVCDPEDGYGRDPSGLHLTGQSQQSQDLGQDHHRPTPECRLLTSHHDVGVWVLQSASGLARGVRQFHLLPLRLQHL